MGGRSVEKNYECLALDVLAGGVGEHRLLIGLVQHDRHEAVSFGDAGVRLDYGDGRFNFGFGQRLKGMSPWQRALGSSAWRILSWSVSGNSMPLYIL